MKSALVSSLLFTLALAGAVPKVNKKVDYNGFKVLRVNLNEKVDKLEALEKLATHVLNPGKASFVDVVVAPENVDAVNALSASTVITEDIGAALKEEGGFSSYAGSYCERI